MVARAPAFRLPGLKIKYNMDYKNVIDKIGIEFEGLYNEIMIGSSTGRYIWSSIQHAFSNKEIAIFHKLRNYSRSGILRITHDGSVHGSYEDGSFLPLEITTDPLNGNEIDKILSFYRDLERMDLYRINDTCGLHFHISVKDNIFGVLCRQEFYNDMRRMFKIRYPEVYERRKRNRFCRAGLIGKDRKEHFNYDAYDRYHLLNYSTEGRAHTIEIRFYGGQGSTIKELRRIIKDTIEVIAYHARLSVDIGQLKVEGYSRPIKSNFKMDIGQSTGRNMDYIFTEKRRAPVLLDMEIRARQSASINY